MAINNSGTIKGEGTLTVDLNNNGVVNVEDGLFDINANLLGTGTVNIAPGATLEIAGSLAAAQTINFNAGGAETLILGSPSGTISNPLTGFASGDRIEFSNGITIGSAPTVKGSTLTVAFRNPGGTGGTYSLTDVTFAPNTPVTYAFGVDPLTGDAFVMPAQSSRQNVLTISGTAAGQNARDAASITPFANVTIQDSGADQNESVRIVLSFAANGSLTNLAGGGYNAATGVYTVTGSLADVVSAVHGLVFSPTPGQVSPGGSVTTGFVISAGDAAGATATDSTTSVVASTSAVPPTITGTAGSQATGDTVPIAPFSNVTVADQNFSQTETVTITLSAAVNGTLSNLGGGSYNASTGVYTDTGGAAAVTTALDGLVFTPARVPAGQTVTTGFAIKVTDTAGVSANDASTSVIASGTSTSSQPTITGTVSGQATTAGTPITPFPRVTIADANSGQTETVTVALSAAANGTLSDLGGGGYNAATGVYTDSGTAGAVTAALDGLVFTPAAGQFTTTVLSIGVTNSAGLSASDNTTGIVAAGTGSTNPGLLVQLNVSQQLELIYVAYFNRAADGDGFNFWEGQNASAQNSGQPAATAVTNIANAFAPQTETEALYPSLVPYLATSNPPPLNTPDGNAALATFITGIYGNLFSRAPDNDGQAYWVNQISSGVVGPGAAALAIANGAIGSDAIEVLNKVNVGLDFTNRTAASGLGVSAGFTAAAHGVLSGIDGTSLNDASVTAGMNETTAYIGGTTGFPTGGSANPAIISVISSQQLVDPGAGNQTIQFLAGASADTETGMDLRSLLSDATVDLSGAPLAPGDHVTVADRGLDALFHFDAGGRDGGLFMSRESGSVVTGLDK